MVCDVCKYSIPTDASGYHHYLLLKNGDTYEACYDGQYKGHSNHKHAKEDVMLCNGCYTMFISKCTSVSKFHLPEAIPLLQSKRFILEIFRRHNAKNRLKR